MLNAIAIKEKIHHLAVQKFYLYYKAADLAVCSFYVAFIYVKLRS